jgi:hypothetical protein
MSSLCNPCAAIARRRRDRVRQEPDEELGSKPALEPTHPDQEPPAETQEDVEQKARRVFPFQSSALDPWRADEFLNKTLGEGKWSLEQRTDRFILSAERDLTSVSSPNRWLFSDRPPLTRD